MPALRVYPAPIAGTRKSGPQFAPVRRCRRFVGNLKFGLPFLAGFRLSAAGGFLCQFRAPTRTVIRTFTSISQSERFRNQGSPKKIQDILKKQAFKETIS